MDASLHTESGVLLWLLVGLVVLVVGQVTFRVLGSGPSSRSGGDDGRRWDLAVFGATGAALGGMLLSVILLIPWGVLNTFLLHVSKGPLPDVFWGWWLAGWSLLPCVVLGYLSGRWWSFLGAAPLLVLFPVGIVFSSGPADWFLTLPVTAAVAVALALGSAVRTVRTRGRPARHHRLLPI
jgi:hypothetical protein